MDLRDPMRVGMDGKGCGTFGEAIGNTLAMSCSPKDKKCNVGKVPIIGERIKGLS